MHNYFLHYNSQGKLYIIIDKINGKKYQFHAESYSFMDETDKPISNAFYESITVGLYDYLIKEISSFQDIYNDFLIDACIKIYELLNDLESVKMIKEKQIIAENNYENSILPF